MVADQVDRAGSLVGCSFAWYSDGLKFDPPVWQHSFVEIGHEIISMAILSLPLIQVGMNIKYWLTASANKKNMFVSGFMTYPNFSRDPKHSIAFVEKKYIIVSLPTLIYIAQP